MHFCFRAGRVLVTDVAVVGRPFECAVHHVGEVGSGFHHPALVEVVGGEHGDGQIVVVHFCLDLSGPCSAYGAATIIVHGFHVIVLHGGVGLHALAFKSESEHESPFLFLAKLFVDSALHGEAEPRLIAFDFANLRGQRQRRSAAEVEACAETHVPAFEGGFQQIVVGVLHFVVGVGCDAEGKEQEEGKNYLFHVRSFGLRGESEEDGGCRSLLFKYKWSTAYSSPFQTTLSSST